MCIALMGTSVVVAQDGTPKKDQPKKECCQDKKSCDKKDAKKTCCNDKASDKKACTKDSKKASCCQDKAKADKK